MVPASFASVSPASETPALAKAKAGSTPNVTHGCRLSSSRSSMPCFSPGFGASGIASAVTTPDSVACTPDFRTHTQMNSPTSA